MLFSFYTKPYIKASKTNKTSLELYIYKNNKKCGDIEITKDDFIVLISCLFNYQKRHMSIEGVGIDYNQGYIKFYSKKTNKCLVKLSCNKNIYDTIIDYVSI